MARIIVAGGAAVAGLGGLDGVVKVAGGFVWETLQDGSLDTWDRMYRMNLRTAVTSCRASGPRSGHRERRRRRCGEGGSGHENLCRVEPGLPSSPSRWWRKWRIAA